MMAVIIFITFLVVLGVNSKPRTDIPRVSLRFVLGAFCRFHASQPGARMALQAPQSWFGALIWRVACCGASIQGNGRGRRRTVMEMPKIEELLRGLLQGLPPGMAHLRNDLEQNFRAVLRANLTKLDLTGRDEFDAQRKVLERTRARLAELEARVAELEQRLAGKAPN
jgi:hypothetical protein